MPTTEPTYGWPVAAGSDPVKQYPAAVDQPFKTQLAAQLKTARSVISCTGNFGGTPTAGAQFFWPLDSGGKISGDALTYVAGDIRVEKAGYYQITGWFSWNQASDAFVQTGTVVASLVVGALIRPGGFVQTSTTQRLISGFRVATAGSQSRLSETVLPTPLAEDEGPVAQSITSIYARLTVALLAL